jgi:hypothetical protein
MKLTITIDGENDAFDPDPVPEVLRILRALSHRLESGSFKLMPQFTNLAQDSAPLPDVNGNIVGRVIGEY